jgi:hypothetical protein
MGLPGERVPSTEDEPRNQIRPGSRIADRIFPLAGGGGPSCLVTEHRQYAGPLEFAYLLSWSGWPDLNRRPLRPEANALGRLLPLLLCLTSLVPSVDVR